MAITNYLVHFKTEDTYNDKKSELRNDAVAFVKDATIIHTHGTDYYCGSGPVALKSDLSGYATTSALTSGLAGKANTSHTHTISQVSGLQEELNSKLESADLSEYALKTDIPSLSGGASATAGQYVSGVTVSGHEVTVTKATLPVTTLSSLGITATAQELNYVDGVTSNIQTQLNGKQATITGGASSIVTSNLAESRALISDASGKVAVSPVTSTELGYLDGVTSNIQTQLNNKVSLVDGVLTLSGNSSTGNVISLSNEGVQDLNIISGAGNNIVLKKSGGPSLSITENGILMGDDSDPYMIVLDISGKTKRIYSNSADLRIQSGMNWLTIPNYSNGDDVKWNEAVILTEDNYKNYISITDTKNTTGTGNSTSILYLVGGTSQNPDGVVTYSNSAVYMQSGQLYATQMNASNGFYETSDARLKNFKDDIKALDVVSKIPTKYFTWKEDENQEPQIGTSAQEVEKLYPELVSKTEDDILTVDYAKLSIIALAAIKELKVEIQSLKEEIKQLKSK